MQNEDIPSRAQVTGLDPNRQAALDEQHAKDERRKQREADDKQEAADRREADAKAEPTGADESLHPNARPARPPAKTGIHPNVPKEGYKPNPANHVGGELPPERQAPRPEDEKTIGTGAVKP